MGPEHVDAAQLLGRLGDRAAAFLGIVRSARMAMAEPPAALISFTTALAAAFGPTR